MKCKGQCGRESPDKYSSGDGFGSYESDTLIEWICPECWKKGVRYSEKKPAHKK